MPGLRQIKASAGSGKTYSLTGIYLDLLRKSAPNARLRRACLGGGGASGGAEEILAITFTNAAAAEMRARVILRLKEIALARDTEANFDAATASAWLEDLLRDYNALNIRTIDSLLHMIARSSALKLNINPDFEPVFNTDEAFAPYVDLFLQRAKTDPEYARLLKAACYAVIEFGAAHQSKGFLAGKKISGALYKLLKAVLTGALNDASDEEEVKVVFEQTVKDAEAAARELIASIPAQAWKKRALEAFSRLAERPTRPPDSTYFKTFDPASCLLKKYADDPAYAQKFQKAAILKNYPERAQVYGKAALFSPFKKIAEIIVAAYMAQMGAEQSVPNDLVPILAAKALSDENGVADAVCRLGTRVSHFLVDEFQDTSDAQWLAMRPLILEALSRGGSLTWVGDLKQSIYGFRGGNPALFDKVAEDKDFVAIAGDACKENLGANWRSAKNIVEFNNALFGSAEDPKTLEKILKKLLGKNAAEILTPTAEEVRNVYLACAQTVAAGGSGYVRGETIEFTSSQDRDEQILERVLEWTREIASRRPLKDIIILVNSNDQAEKLARVLIDAKIPVITENSLLVADHPLIAQAAALITFLANPADDLAFWALITGPLLANNDIVAWPTEEELYQWAAARQKTPLFQAFARDYPEQWLRIIEPFYNQSQLLAPYDVIMEWFAFMDAENRRPADKSFIRRFMEIAHRAENEGVHSLTAFADFWNSKGSEEKIPMPENANAARIMTIHKAKGLQAPVVIVPYTNFKVYPSGAPTLRELDGLKLPMFATSAVAGEEFYASLKANALEAFNKLYVAFTRPEEELYFISAVETKMDKADSLVAILADKAGFTLPLAIGSPAAAETPEPGAETVPKTATSRETPPPDWRPMAWLPQLKIFRSQLNPRDLSPAERGSLLHAAIDNLPLDTPPDKAATEALAYAEKSLNFIYEQGDADRAKNLEALAWFAALPDVKAWFDNGVLEQSLIDSDGRVLRADLIATTPRGSLVIDFKTGSPTEANVTQIRAYMRRVQESAQKNEPVLGLLVYLDEKKFRLIDQNEAHPLTADYQNDIRPNLV